MEINTEKWGLESEWQVETNLSTATWQDTDLLFYNGKYRALSDYRTNGVFDYNTPIDYSIAYSAHAAAEKMPLADMAIYDYQGTKKYTVETDNGWFFTNQIAESTTAWNYYELLSAFETGSPTNLYELGGAYRWSPDAVNYSDIYPRPSNLNRRLRPIVKFSPKSFFGVVYVQLVKNDYTDMTTVSLKTLKNNINTYKDTYFIMKAYMRMYAYNGRVSQDGNYNNFSLKSLTNFGVSTTQPLKVGAKDLITYYQTVGSSYYTFPIAGTLEYVKNYYYGTNHYGVRVAPQTTDSGGGDEYMQGVTMAHLVDSVNVQYYYDPNSTGRTYVLQVKIPITAENIEELYKGAAAYGIFFSDDVNGLNVDTTNVARWLNENMYCGVLDENGVGHGEYTKGFGNAANPIFLWDSNQDSPYDYTKPLTPIDTNTYSNSSHFNSFQGISGGTKLYAIDLLSLNLLMSDLWSLMTTLSQDSFEHFTQKVQAGMLVTNPIDSIVSVMCFPFVLPNTGQSEPIKLGKYDMTATGIPITSELFTIDFVGKDIFPRFGDCYLDYEPYTNYEIYVPFCGTIPLKAADILGHTLNVKLIVDLLTGSCTGYVMADGLVIETVTGTVGITVPISGMDSSTINSQIVNANLNYKSAQYSAGAAIGSMVSVGGAISALSNPAEAVNKIAQSQITEERAKYDLTHIPTQPHIIGASSPALGWCCDTMARIMIYYPTGDVITKSKPPSLINDKIKSFGDLNGFSCLKWGKVKEFNGFTLGNIKLDGVPCTESERARLKQLFSTGVYL